MDKPAPDQSADHAPPYLPLSLKRVGAFLGLSLLAHSCLLLTDPPESRPVPNKPAGLSELHVQLQQAGPKTPPPPPKPAPPPPTPRAKPQPRKAPTPPVAAASKKAAPAKAAPTPAAPPTAIITALPENPTDFELARPGESEARDAKPAPQIDLEAARRMARDIDRNRRDKGPAPSHPALAKTEKERETAMGRSIDQAARADCRNAYASAGLLAVPMLIKDGVTDKGCKW